jgi:hypothetical protein
VALFRLGYDHFYLVPTYWTSNDPGAVFDVIKQIAQLFASDILTPATVMIFAALMLALMGTMLLSRNNIKDFDDVAMLACFICFLASFKLTPLSNMFVMWLMLSNKPTVRKFLNRGIEQPMPPQTVNIPIIRRIAGALLILSPFYFLGYAAAATPRTYYLSQTSPKYALIQTFGDYLICEPANLTSGPSGVDLRVSSSVRFFKLGEPATPQFDAVTVSSAAGPIPRVVWPISWFYIP